MKMVQRQPCFLPRLLRLRDAPFYVGMDRNRFNKEVRPYIVEVRIGKQGIDFDRVDLDAWVEQYKSRNGRLASDSRGEQIWDAKEAQGCGIVAGSGISKSKFSAERFTKALAQVNLKKRS